MWGCVRNTGWRGHGAETAGEGRGQTSLRSSPHSGPHQRAARPGCWWRGWGKNRLRGGGQRDPGWARPFCSRRNEPAAGDPHWRQQGAAQPRVGSAPLSAAPACSSAGSPRAPGVPQCLWGWLWVTAALGCRRTFECFTGLERQHKPICKDAFPCWTVRSGCSLWVKGVTGVVEK